MGIDIKLYSVLKVNIDFESQKAIERYGLKRNHNLNKAL